MDAVHINITLPNELLDQIRIYCKQNEITVSGLFRKGARKIMDTN